MAIREIIDRDRFFVKATGTRESPPQLRPETMPPAVGKGQEKEVGRYGSNNGTLAFVDGERDYWVAPYSERAEKALQDAGYEQGGVFVPHSNDCGQMLRVLVHRAGIYNPRRE